METTTKVAPKWMPLAGLALPQFVGRLWVK